MQKFIIGATAALIATVSMAASAEAGWKWKHGHNHGWKWKHGNHHGIKIYSPGYNDYCQEDQEVRRLGQCLHQEGSRLRLLMTIHLLSEAVTSSH